MLDNVDIIDLVDINDVIDPNEKKRYSFKATFRKEDETGIKDVGRDTYTSVASGELAAPFNLISSSLESGYNNQIVNRFKTSSAVVNLHSDTFLNDNQIPMQGPFAEQHVGGHQSRHVPLNRYTSSNSTLNNIDDYNTRPEAWRMLLGNAFSSSGNAMLGFVGPDYPVTPGGTYPQPEFKRATYYRNVGAKRPLNIRNIKYSTASVNLGNYSKDYEIVQTVGRSANNRYFVDNEGISLPDLLKSTNELPPTTNVNTFIGINPQTTNAGNFFGPAQASPSTLSNRFSDSNTYAVRSRTKNDFVFVQRFSAPGGPEISSLGYLDIMAEEKSVYNALPYRNLSVRGSGSGESTTMRVNDQLDERRGLRSLLSSHAGQFGHDPNFGSITIDGYVAKPSYQKTNRNTKKRIKFNGVGGYDEGQSTTTGSVYDNSYVSYAIPQSDLQYSWVTSSYETQRIYGHAWNDSFVSNSAGVEQAIDFVSASVISAGGIRVDFANLNTLINDPIDIANNIVSSSTGEYRNTEIASLSAVDSFNSLLLHRNGPYGVNSWNQLRRGANPIARLMRKKNFISFVDKTTMGYPVSSVAANPTPIFGSPERFTESPVVSRHSSLIQSLKVKKLTSDGRTVDTPLLVQSSYGNNLQMFNNNQLNSKYNVKQITPQPYDSIKDLYLNNQEGNPDSPVNSFDYLIYRENIYPSSVNVFSSQRSYTEKLC